MCDILIIMSAMFGTKIKCSTYYMINSKVKKHFRDQKKQQPKANICIFVKIKKIQVFYMD